MTIQQWSTVPATNASAVTNVNMATGSAPSTVHPSVRQMMADVAAWYASAEWLVQADVPTFVSATQFTVPANRTSAFSVNRRVQAVVTAGTITGTITASVFGASTTVTVAWDSTALDAGLSQVAIGILQQSNLSASVLTGTLPNAVFPATLPASSGVNLTALNASNLGSGTVPSGRVSGSYAGITALGTITGLALSDTLNMSSATTIAAGYGATMGIAAGQAGSVHRVFIGDGSGWALKIASRVASVTTDRFTFADTGAFTASNGITASAGGASITGNTSIAGGTFSSRGFADNATAAQWNIDASGRLLNNGGAQPAVGTSASASRSTGGTFTTFTELTDKGNNFVAATGIFTAPVAGTYLVCASYSGSVASGTGTAQCQIFKNGSFIPVDPGASFLALSTGISSCSTCTVLTLAASDTVNFQLGTVSGTTPNVACQSASIVFLG